MLWNFSFNYTDFISTLTKQLSSRHKNRPECSELLIKVGPYWPLRVIIPSHEDSRHQSSQPVLFQKLHLKFRLMHREHNTWSEKVWYWSSSTMFTAPGTFLERTRSVSRLGESYVCVKFYLCLGMAFSQPFTVLAYFLSRILKSRQCRNQGVAQNGTNSGVDTVPGVGDTQSRCV